MSIPIKSVKSVESVILEIKINDKELIDKVPDLIANETIEKFNTYNNDVKQLINNYTLIKNLIVADINETYKKLMDLATTYIRDKLKNKIILVEGICNNWEPKFRKTKWIDANYGKYLGIQLFIKEMYKSGYIASFDDETSFGNSEKETVYVTCTF